MLVGYARVSTTDQETNLQLDALSAAGVAVVFQEKASAVSHRPELHAAIAYMSPGQTLVVWKLDRLARSLFDLLGLLEALGRKGCSFRSLTEPIDTSSPMGIFVLQILGAVAQLERSMIIERTKAGIAAHSPGSAPSSIAKNAAMRGLTCPFFFACDIDASVILRSRAHAAALCRCSALSSSAAVSCIVFPFSQG